MYLHELKLTNFKNCESADLQLSENVNCFEVLFELITLT